MCPSSQEDKHPDKGEMSTRKTIIQRVGIGYSYPRTLVFVALWLITIEVPLIIGGVPLDLIASDLLAWAIPILLLFLTYLMNYSLVNFGILFGLRELATGKGNRENIKAQEPVVRKILPTEFEEYRGDLRYWFYSLPGQVGFGVAAVTLLMVMMQPWNWQMVPFGGLDYRGYVSQVTAVRAWIALFWTAAVVFFVGVIANMALNMLAQVIVIGQRYKPGEGKDSVLFATFHKSVRDIGGFLYGFCVRLIVGGIMIVWVTIAYDMLFGPTGHISTRGIFVSLLVLLLVFIAFVVPQINIHSKLRTSRANLLSKLDEEYENLQNRLSKSLEKLGSDDKSLLTEKEIQNNQLIRENMTALETRMKHVESMGLWSFSFPAVLKLLAAAAIPLLTALLQFAASGLLAQLMSI